MYLSFLLYLFLSIGLIVGEDILGIYQLIRLDIEFTKIILQLLNYRHKVIQKVRAKAHISRSYVLLKRDQTLYFLSGL